ncbi:MAG: hypothetical protein AB1489_35710 [Acidobacteriota bacterium]
MFKRNRLLTLIITLLLLTSTLLAQQRPQADRASILAATDNILKDVSQMRGLPAKTPVKSGFKTHSELETIIIRDLDEENSPQELQTQTKLLTRLGLIPKGYAIREEMIKLLGEQIGGFYEPRTGEFYLVDWLELEEQKPVMAHELMHAIQDQNFDLRRFEKFPKDQGDQELAIHALIEGEATVVMFNYIFKPQGLDITKIPIPLSSILDTANKGDDARFPILTNTPAAIRETLEFPYFYGASFVQEVVRRSSWQKISDLYTELPESTEQILHPDKFFERDHPIKIKLAELSKELGKGWRKSDINIHGEFGYYLILAQYLDKKRAQAAAAGWGGDQFIFYEQTDGDNNAITQFTTWDQEKEAVEFFEAYNERTLKRYHQPKPVKEEANLKIYNTEDGLILIERRNADVLIIEGLKESQLPTTRDAIWKQYPIATTSNK